MRHALLPAAALLCAACSRTVLDAGDLPAGGSPPAPECPTPDFPRECRAEPSEARGKADCDDGDPGTADRCVPFEGGAVCAHVPAPCDHYDPADVQRARCDDGEACTADRCGGDNGCEHVAVAGCLPL